jgi:hypothetical protein
MPSPAESLRQLAAAGLLRTQRPLDSAAGIRVTREGRELWNFSSNDYLGLARHPEIEAALIEGVQRFGAGAAASRLVAGTLPPHVRLENALAEAKQTEAALTFSSGFAAALGAKKASRPCCCRSARPGTPTCCLLRGSEDGQAAAWMSPPETAVKAYQAFSPAQILWCCCFVVSQYVFTSDLHWV